MINATLRICPEGNSVILPCSNSVLSRDDINRKIEKAKEHIGHLTKAQSTKKTHRGKRFRARQISLKDQVQVHSKRLERLDSTKNTMVKINNFDQLKNELRGLNLSDKRFSQVTCLEILGCEILFGDGRERVDKIRKEGQKEGKGNRFARW